MTMGRPVTLFAKYFVVFRGALYQNKHPVLSASTGTHTLVYCPRPNSTQQEVFDFYNKKSSIQMSSLYCKHSQIPATTSSKATNIWTLKLTRHLYSFTPILWSYSENQESSQTSRYLPHRKLTCWTWTKRYLTLLIFESDTSNLCKLIIIRN